MGDLNVTHERFLFFKRDQLPEVSFDGYLASLQTLASTCEFGDLEEDLIRDRIVCGLRDKSVQRSLLQKTKLTLKYCDEVCRMVEASTERLREIKASASKAVNEIELTAMRVKETTSAATTTRRIKKCGYCGGAHERGKCPAYGKECRLCKKKNNHFASVCEARVRQLEIEPDRETKVMLLSFDIAQSERDAVNVVNL